MSDINEVKNKPKSMWKFWLGVILFVAFIIGVNYEKSTPAYKENLKQNLQNSQVIIYNETYDSCGNNEREAECRAQAKEAAIALGQRLKPQLGLK